jgi:hypothetical protein
MSTAVETVFIGKDRKFNRRFEQLMSHHLIEPTACTPGAGWEKGQVENQVGVIRKQFFAPRPSFESLEDLNAWLADGCIAYAKKQAHPEQTDKTVFEMFEAERAVLMTYRGPFDGFHDTTATVSKTCLVRFDRNKYSVNASAVGRLVDVYAYADRVVLKQDGVIVGEHARRFGRNQTVYDPWHYVATLAKKPGALRNGAPFKDWVLPGSIEEVRVRLGRSDEGDRQMVKILAAVLTDGLVAVEAACAEALAAGITNADVILNALARRQQPQPPPSTSPLGKITWTGRASRRVYRTVDHVPDRSCSMDPAGAAIRSVVSRTISLFLARYGFGARISAAVLKARCVSISGGWITTMKPSATAMSCASASAPMASPWCRTAPA